MTTTYPMYAEVARLEIDQRLREADAKRRRRLARHAHPRVAHLAWG